MDLLRALGTFVRITETGSFSAVARESNSTPSAVTRLIGQLEEHFRVRLFHRTTRHLSLTEDGQDLLAHARSIIEATTDLEDTIGNQRTAPTGRVRVGLTHGAARLLTPGLIDLLTRYPGLSVDFVVREQFGDLIEDRLDLAMRLGQPTDASLVARSVGEFGRALVASPAYLERHGAPSDPAALTMHRCIAQDGEPANATWRFNGPGGPHNIEVTSSFSANNAEVVRQAALSGHGIALLPEPQVLDDILGARLYRLLPDYPTDRTKAFLVYPSRRHLPPRTRVVIDFLVERFAAVGARLADERVWGEHETVWLV
ncbi:MAG: LysR family transcriptional regulator [Acetobacteraceae bacterium]|jgi:DNA-binding transcriptional LysR family regulator